ncbi:MAG: hypothetical protein ABI718_10670 [Acidobacteriota bacterium]
MKTYTIVTGAIFGLITVAHVWRMFVERSMAAQPWFVLLSVASAILCLWAGSLLRSERGKSAFSADGNPPAKDR